MTWRAMQLRNQAIAGLVQFRSTRHQDKTDNRRGILDTEAVISTTSVRTHGLGLNCLARIHRPLDLAPCQPPCQFGNKNCNAHCNHFSPQRQRRHSTMRHPADSVWRQSPNQEMSGHPTPAPRHAHQYARSQPPFYCKTPPMIPL